MGIRRTGCSVRDGKCGRAADGRRSESNLGHAAGTKTGRLVGQGRNVWHGIA